MGASPYDIGIPMDVELHLRQMAEALGASVIEIAHALMRESIFRITQGQQDMPKAEYAAAARSWWNSVGEGKKK